MQGTPDDKSDDFYDIKKFKDFVSENNFFDIHNFKKLEANQNVKTFHFNPSGFNNSGSIVTISNDGEMQDYEINRLKDSIFLNKDGADNPQKDEYPFLAPEENEYRLALKDQWNLLVSIQQTDQEDSRKSKHYFGFIDPLRYKDGTFSYKSNMNHYVDDSASFVSKLPADNGKFSSAYRAGIPIQTYFECSGF